MYFVTNTTIVSHKDTNFVVIKKKYLEFPSNFALPAGAVLTPMEKLGFDASDVNA